MNSSQYVLVIEDNAMNADVLKENLTDAGYEFALAVNGAAGVAAANELLPDIILMDVNLPILDGLSATRLLKKNSNTQSIPIVALTARAMSGDRDICLAAGCDDYISKPVDMDVLLAKMQHHLAKRPKAFVDMIHRQREEAEVSRLVLTDMPTNGVSMRSGMAPTDYEEEFATLNQTVERLEGELREAQGRAGELEEALADREQQIAAVIQERDAARRQAERTGARVGSLAEDRDQIRGERDQFRAERDALLAERDRLREERDQLRTERAGLVEAKASTTPVAAKESSEAPDDAQENRARRRVRKLQHQLELEQERTADLQRQIDSIPGDLRSLQQQHERLRKAFMQLHRTVVKSAEEALHQVAFGG
jgi:two-component system, cell cycle response regulator DivK